METKFMLLLAVVLLAACDGPKYAQYEVDQKERQRIFKECMAALPAGPTQVGTSNDWDEVVEACDSAAADQAKVCYENCPLARITPAAQESEP